MRMSSCLLGMEVWIISTHTYRSDRDLLIHEAHQRGATIREIAGVFRIPPGTVREVLNLPWMRPPERFEILMPVNVLYRGEDPERCPHGRIRDGDNVYCPRCHRTSHEDHPRLRKPRKVAKQHETAKFRPRGAKRP
jgi:hypothetical protein